MKKVITLSALLLSVVFLNSCDKAAKLLFQPFESPLNFNVEIPAISTTTADTAMGSTVVNFNLDEEVKAQTDGKVDGSAVGAMYLNEVSINLQNADQENDLRNFEYVRLKVQSGSATPVEFGPFQIPSDAINSASFVVSNSPDIKPFFNGSNVTFSLSGKAKTATTKALNAQIGATIKFDK